MPQLNQVSVIGRLGRDPDIRQAGAARVANLSLAVDSGYKDATSGQWHKKTTWIRATLWGKQADSLASLQKGDDVFISGELESRSWQDKDGQKREAIEIKARIVLPVGNAGQTQERLVQRDLDDEIPF